MNYTSLKEIQEKIRLGELSCEKMVEHYLQQIESTQDLNIYVEVFAKEAIQKAKELDKKHQKGDRVGELHGMVISIKDVICYEGHKVTAASKILSGFESLYSATALERLLAEDIIIIGRVNCDQFAMGSDNENSCYGQTRNAINKERVPGGSSGGSAVSVQAGTCLASLGSDTGGSVRQPAAFCGIIGMKPSYGRISRYGLLAYGSSFDQIGILANSISDTALLLKIMSGKDQRDSTSSSEAVPAYSQQLGFDKKVKIAYFEKALQHESIDIEVKQKSLDLIDKLQAEGHEVEAVDFEYLDYLIPAYYVLTTAEASSNLSRYDGVRYGHRAENVKNLEDTYAHSRTEGFSIEVKRRIMLGTFVLSAGYYDAYYTKAQKVRRLIFEKTKEIFKEYDFILMPTTPTTAWKIGEKSNDPVEMYLADIFTVQANMTGIPAISIPFSKLNNGLPIGIQFMANSFEESSLLGFSNYVMEKIL